MYIRGLIPRDFAQLAEAVPIVVLSDNIDQRHMNINDLSHNIRESSWKSILWMQELSTSSVA